MRRWFLVWLVAAPVLASATSETRVDLDHPRLLLTGRRLRLLRRERERDSMRWRQFAALIQGNARMPEPGFAQALYYQVAGDKSRGRAAVEWALSAQDADLRQMALVFDWCQDLLYGEESTKLVEKLQTGLKRPAKDDDIGLVAGQVLAAIALAGHVPEGPEAKLGETLRTWWAERVAGKLETRKFHVPRRQLYAFFEMLHAVRDNLGVDLREAAPSYFTELPAYLLLSYFPAPFEGGETEYRIPAFGRPAAPDVELASLSRAAELAMVAYDANAPATQFLQGWLIRDRFLLRAPFGAPYEFLWANPYQPGLSVYHMPLYFHEPKSGTLFIRSSWEEDARWFGLEGGVMQLFENGRAMAVDPQRSGMGLQFGSIAVAFSPVQMAFPVQASEDQPRILFVVGLQPFCEYRVHVSDGTEVTEAADAGGVMMLKFPQGSRLAVRVSPIEGSADQRRPR